MQHIRFKIKYLHEVHTIKITASDISKLTDHYFDLDLLAERYEYRIIQRDNRYRMNE